MTLNVGPIVSPENSGSGKLVLLLGALMAEASFVMAIYAGAKASKKQKQARHASASERRRR